MTLLIALPYVIYDENEDSYPPDGFRKEVKIGVAGSTRRSVSTSNANRLDHEEFRHEGIFLRIFSTEHMDYMRAITLHSYLHFQPTYKL